MGARVFKAIGGACASAISARTVGAARALTPGVLATAILLVPATALALTPGRAYERVTPLYSGGYGTRAIFGVAPDGESIAVGSPGVWAGAGSDSTENAYQATRSESGWSTTSLMPAASFITKPGHPIGFSPSLDASLWELGLGEPSDNSASNEVQFATHPVGAPDGSAGFEPVGPLVKALNGQVAAGKSRIFGYSENLCHLAMESVDLETEPAHPSQLPEIHPGPLYEVAGNCQGQQPYVRLLALNDNGAFLGKGEEECPYLGHADEDRFNAMSADGSEVFFQDAFGDHCNERAPQLFVRVGGEKTLEVSKPLGECPGNEVPCAGGATRERARFWGASEDGSRVFFTSAAPLDAESDDGEDLYMASIGCPGETTGCTASQRVVTGLTQVSRDVQAGQAAEVQGVVGIAATGDRVYFVARGVLSEASNSQGAVAGRGADNLYVYDALSGQTTFVGDLCSGAERSGALADFACPATLQSSEQHSDTSMWAGRFAGSDQSPVQVAGEGGRFLVFTTYARLIGSGPQADTDNAQDVYRYDAQTGGLQRISVGENGFDDNGNSSDGESETWQINKHPAASADARTSPEVTGLIDQEERSGVRRAVSEDGSRIVFSTAAPLSPDATNGQVDVYEWHEGAVSLISCGCSTEGDLEPVITPSGRDIFFVTEAELVPGNNNGLPVVYDARIGGGFPAAEAPAERCEGDACQGPLSTPAPLLVPGSAVQAAGENVAASSPDAGDGKASHKPKPTRKSQKRSKKRRCARRGKSCASQRRAGGKRE